MHRKGGTENKSCRMCFRRNSLVTYRRLYIKPEIGNTLFKLFGKMSSRRSVAPRSFEQSSLDNDSSKGENENKASGVRKKSKCTGTVVKSRYMQPVEKTSLPKRPSSPKPAGVVRPRVATPPRRSMAPPRPATVTTPPRRSMAPPRPASVTSSLLEPPLLGISILQSTFTDGHYTQPEFDLSVIRETTMQHPGEPDRIVETDGMNMESFLLDYLTVKIQSNTAKLKATAEASMLQMIEEEEKLQRENQEKERQYLLMEQDKRTKELLELQIAVLTPVAAAAKQFTEEYQTLATAVDTTRHTLPVKNIHIPGDGGDFLGEVETRLKAMEAVLLQRASPSSQLEQSAAADCLRLMKTTSQDISQQLSGGCSEVVELSSLLSCQSILAQLVLEENTVGFTRAQELYCPVK